MTHKHPTCFFLPDGIIWQGNWSSRIYHEEDVVTHEGSPYVCIKNTIDPDLPPTASSKHWIPFEPNNYVETIWKPKFYPEGALVSYQNETYMCWKKATLEPPTDESHWTKAKYKHRGSWVKLAYNPGDVVLHKSQHYQCIKTSFTEKPNNYVHWKAVQKPEGFASDWRPMRYIVHDVVSYDKQLYVCICATSTDPPTDDQFWQPLPKNSVWKGPWRKESYPAGTLVLDVNKKLYVTYTEATDEPLVDSNGSPTTWFPLHHINWRHVWINQNYGAGDFLIYDQRAFICIKNTVNAEHPTNPEFWVMFCQGGVEFPPWFPHPRTISIDIPFDQDLEYSVSSGGFYWPISPPKYLGYETIKTENMFEENRPYFESLGVTEVKQVYLLTEWHVGEYAKEGEEPARFYGAVIDGYYEPPSINNKNVTQNMIPMTNPKTGEPRYRFYIQWRASDLPYIAQPDECDWLVLFNREPHPKITEFFKVATNHIQISNRLRMDNAAFEDEMRDILSYTTYQNREANRQTEAGEKGIEYKQISYDDYVEEHQAAWTQNKFQMKMVHMKLGSALFEKATEHVKIWLDQQVKNLRSRTREISALITSSVQQHVGWDKWFNLTAAQCRKLYPNITWSANGENIKLSDVEKKREELDKMWKIYEAGPAMGRAHFINFLERDINEILGMFPVKTSKKKSTRQRKKGKKY